MKKVVVKLDLHDDREKQKALKAVSTLLGIESIAMDMKERKMTVIGAIDPVDVVAKLRKCWNVDIVSVGPKDEKKDGDKKDGDKKDADKVDWNKIMALGYYPPKHIVPYYVVQPQSMEEDPNSCVIC